VAYPISDYGAVVKMLNNTESRISSDEWEAVSSTAKIGVKVASIDESWFSVDVWIKKN
jgi:hypothetical protein